MNSNSTDPPSAVPRPHLEPLMPLLTAAQYRLLCGLARAPQSLLDSEFSDALYLIRNLLSALDRRTDLLAITDHGRRFLAAGP